VSVTVVAVAGYLQPLLPGVPLSVWWIACYAIFLGNQHLRRRTHDARAAAAHTHGTVRLGGVLRRVRSEGRVRRQAALQCRSRTGPKCERSSEGLVRRVRGVPVRHLVVPRDREPAARSGGDSRRGARCAQSAHHRHLHAAGALVVRAGVEHRGRRWRGCDGQVRRADVGRSARTVWPRRADHLTGRARTGGLAHHHSRFDLRLRAG